MNTFKAQLVGNFLKILSLPLCFFLLQACSNSQFEKRLADSFDTPLKADISLDKTEDPISNSSPSIEEIKDSDVRQAQEVKPKKQTKPPKKKSRVTKSYLYELTTYAINQAKWKAAQEYCLDRRIEFKLITEDELGIK